MTYFSLRRRATSTSDDTDPRDTALPPLPTLSTAYPTLTSTSIQQSTSCGGCFDVFYLSMVGVVGQSLVDTSDASPISTNEAVSLIAMTQEIGTITVDARGNIHGFLTSDAIEVVPSYALDNYTVVDGTTVAYGKAYLSALSTIVQDYTSWQTILDAGVCIETSQVISFGSTITFFDGDMTQSFNQILGSAVTTRLPRPTCTSTSAVVSTTRSIPIFKSATQTATNDISDIVDRRVTTAAKVGLGVTFGFSIFLILGFLLFFLWKRRKTNPKQNQATSSSGQQRSNSVVSQTHGIHDRVGETSDLETTTEAANHEHKVLWKSYWRAPMFMFGGILAGMGLALGHHFLYAGINMQPVDDVSLSQAWIIRFGTLLAFLVKLSFAISVGTSFVQLQWWKLRQKPRTIKEIDVLSSILGNILSGFDRTWLHFRGLTLLALIFWLFPILPVITPGTLNVQSSIQTKELPLTVPKLIANNDKTSEVWGSWTGQIGGRITDFTPSFGLAQVYMPVAIGAQMLSILPQYPNQTFHLDFFGPAVNCSEADENTVLAITEKYGIPAVSPLPVQIAYHYYYSWVGGDEWLSSKDYPKNVDLTSEDTARLFLMVAVLGGPAPNVTINNQTYWIPRVTECSLYNASYNVDFIFHNSEQTVEANVTFLHNVPAIVPATGGNAVEVDSYTALMAGLGNLLVGTISVDTMQQLVGAAYQYTQAAHLNQIFLDGVDYNEQLAADIEEMFRNMTLSLLTSGRPEFTTNQTVMGTVTASVIVYTYDPMVLFLVYGLALVLTSLCAAVGFYAFTVNDGSYQNIFSTFLRTTKDANLIIEDDDTGRDPRPKNLSTVKVKVTPGRLEVDPWLQDPAQRVLLVRQPELNTVPTTTQQEELRQRHPSGRNRPDTEVVAGQGESDNHQEVLERHQSRSNQSSFQPRQESLQHRTNHASPALRRT